MRIAITIILIVALTNVAAETLNHGFVRNEPNNLQQVWDMNINEWSDIESFWMRHVERNGGLTWGKKSTYPQYNDIQEYDTLLIELEQGTCLMEFFHSRWRRANDVRRWDDAFNEFGGCPYVFD